MLIKITLGRNQKTTFMIFNTLQTFIAFCLISFTSCVQNETGPAQEPEETVTTQHENPEPEPHRYGGWYCPDNLNGFPAVDINDWQNVPVVSGRMPTKEETQSEASLIYVDPEKYPNAKALDMKLPRLAIFYNENADREDLVIVIQAINVTNDSIVGFRYLNGGNGSSRLDEVRFLEDHEIAKYPTSKFITHSVYINARQKNIWKVLRDEAYTDQFTNLFDLDKKEQKDWRDKTNVNFYYPEAGRSSSEYADLLFGNYYIQNDYKDNHYNQKFLLLENEYTKMTELRIVCGPHTDDYDTHKNIISKWAGKVKDLSEI
jgi:hypothetical protein